MLLLVAVSTRFQRNDKPNRHAFHDAGQAMANLSLQATEMGIFVHQMAGFDADQTRTTFQLPEHIEPVTVTALGYPADPDHLTEEEKEREYRSRSRRETSEFVFHGRWEG